MFKETQLFMEELEKNDLSGTLVEEDDENNIVRLLFGLQSTDMRVYLFFEADGHLGIRCNSFLRVTEDQFPAAVICCNELNKEMRWVKFYIDDDRDVNLEDDAILDPHSAGKEAFELIMRMATIADEAYPLINKAIWT